MAKPNLALIPATIGDKVYSILPSDGVGDFDFTRASTATRINAQGLIETVASGENRLNYSLLDGKVVGCPHLLLEPARTNLVTYSEDFTTWGGSGDITSNYAISPDGTQNASRCLFTAANQSLSSGSTLSTGVSCSATIYVKGVSGETIQLAAGGVDAIHILNGSWQRIETNTTSINSSIVLNTFGGATARDLLIWGAQLEQGSYATSYIPTSGSAVTRAAETCNGSGDAATFNDSEGVLFANISQDNDGFNTISISDGGTSDRITIAYQNNTIKSILVYNNTVKQLESTNYPQNLFHKVAIKYTASNVSLIINGFELLTTSKGAFADSLTTLEFAQGNGGNNFYGKTKQLQYFDTTDIDLEQLTSWDSFRAMAEGQLYTIE